MQKGVCKKQHYELKMQLSTNHLMDDGGGDVCCECFVAIGK